MFFHLSRINPNILPWSVTPYMTGPDLTLLLLFTLILKLQPHWSSFCLLITTSSYLSQCLCTYCFILPSVPIPQVVINSCLLLIIQVSTRISPSSEAVPLAEGAPHHPQALLNPSLRFIFFIALSAVYLCLYYFHFLIVFSHKKITSESCSLMHLISPVPRTWLGT